MVRDSHEQFWLPMGLEGMVRHMNHRTILLFISGFSRTPDLSLSSHHPKRNFMRRAIEVEIRLAYFDRIQKSLPEPFQNPDADALPDQAPGPEFDYDDPGKLDF